MKAAIIAAGRGKRLGDLTQSEAKPLVKLLGLSLIERVILTAKQAGITEFIVVIGYLGDRIKEALGDGCRYGVRIDYIQNEGWEAGNATSVLKCKELLTDRFVLLMSDHMFDQRVLQGLLSADMSSSVMLAVDRSEAALEDTKVLEDNGKIVRIGKDLREANCVDTGLFLCSPKLFRYLESSVSEGNFELSGGIARAAANGDAEIFDIGLCESYITKMRKEAKPWWIDVDTVADLKRARGIIVENASKNPSDFLARYVHKSIENRLVAVISNFGVTPNQLTITANLLAYTVVALYFFGYLLTAAILSFIVGIVDGLDGKLARVKLKTTKVGQLEHSFDLLFEFSWFLGLSLFLFRSSRDATPLVLCILIIVLVAFYRHVYDQFRGATGRSLDDYGTLERRFRRIAGRRNLYNIPILVSILMDVPVYGLFFVVFHAGVTAAVYSLRAIKHLRAIDKLG
ncbi:MAG: sugar phosphate nucleotidyltransferase [Planctomycetota bacterium]|jgi:CDP-L-myo-inositol myo-inositolphosphotransferase